MVKYLLPPIYNWIAVEISLHEGRGKFTDTAQIKGNLKIFKNKNVKIFIPFLKILFKPAQIMIVGRFLNWRSSNFQHFGCLALALYWILRLLRHSRNIFLKICINYSIFIKFLSNPGQKFLDMPLFLYLNLWPKLTPSPIIWVVNFFERRVIQKTFYIRLFQIS